MKLLSRKSPVVVVIVLWCLALPGSILAATNYVAFGNYYFKPSSLTIHVGDTVIWTNAGGFHTVTGQTASEPLCGSSQGIQSCTNTFNEPGVFPYRCNLHYSLGMTGVVSVAGVLPSTAVLTNAAWTNGGFVFTALTTASQTNIVQAATNLAGTANWISLQTNVPTTNTFTFTDTNATRFQRRFYRVEEH